MLLHIWSKYEVSRSNGFGCRRRHGQTDGRRDGRTDGETDGRTEGKPISPSWVYDPAGDKNEVNCKYLEHLLSSFRSVFMVEFLFSTFSKLKIK